MEGESLEFFLVEMYHTTMQQLKIRQFHMMEGVEVQVLQPLVLQQMVLVMSQQALFDNVVAVALVVVPPILLLV